MQLLRASDLNNLWAARVTAGYLESCKKSVQILVQMLYSPLSSVNASLIISFNCRRSNDARFIVL